MTTETHSAYPLVPPDVLPSQSPHQLLPVNGLVRAQDHGSYLEHRDHFLQTDLQFMEGGKTKFQLQAAYSVHAVYQFPLQKIFSYK